MFTGVSSKKTSTTENLALKAILSVLLVLLTNSLKAESPTSPKGKLSHSLDSLKFTLNNEQKQCQLQVTSTSADVEVKTIPLLLDSPCYWVVSAESKALLHYSYKSADADNTLLIAGTPLDWSADKKSYQKLPSDSYCTQYLQGIVISKKQAFAVDEKMIAAHCETGLAIDEKIFYAIAHNPVRYQDESGISSVAPVKPELKDTAESAKALPKATSQKPDKPEEKSFLDSVTDTVKEFFSGKSKDAE